MRASEPLPVGPLRVPKAHGRPRTNVAGMNKLEESYASHLQTGRSIGRVSKWGFQTVTLKLGDDCRYTPDFYTLMQDGTVEFAETKGFMRDDALVKIKTAATQYPEFRFVLVTKNKDTGTLDSKEIKPS